MSACISKHGEYSAHEPGDWCPRCGVFNEDAVFAEVDALRAKLADATTVRTVGDPTARHIGKRVRVRHYDGTLIRLRVTAGGAYLRLLDKDTFMLGITDPSFGPGELDTPCEVLP